MSGLRPGRIEAYYQQKKVTDWLHHSNECAPIYCFNKLPNFQRYPEEDPHVETLVTFTQELSFAQQMFFSIYETSPVQVNNLGQLYLRFLPRK